MQLFLDSLLIGTAAPVELNPALILINLKSVFRGKKFYTYQIKTDFLPIILLKESGKGCQILGTFEILLFP